MTDAEPTRAFGNTAPSAALPDVAHEIHFSRGTGEDVRGLPVMLFVQAAGLLFVAVVVVGVSLRYTAGFGWGLDAVLRWVGPALIVLVGALWLTQIQRGRHWRRAHTHLPEQADPTVRLRCIGSLEDLIPTGELRDVPFEPQQFWIPLGLPEESVTKRWRWTFIGLAVLAAACLSWSINGISSGSALFFWASLIVGHLSFSLIAPAYVRLAPGRLITIQCLPIGAPLVRAYDLRAARVLVDLCAARVSLKSPEDKPWLELPFVAAPRRAELGYYVLLGALSTYTPPAAEDAA